MPHEYNHRKYPDLFDHVPMLAAPETLDQDITAVMTILGGKPVYGDGEFKDLAPRLPPAMPDWSPAGFFGGYQKRAERDTATKYAFAAACGCDRVCNVHGHAHANSWTANVPVSDDKSFWGAIGCSCWAF